MKYFELDLMDAIWKTCTFDDLSNTELYALLRLRSEVFQIEQACLYPDLDGLDQEAIHVMALAGNKPIAYARILPKGGTTVAIGRVTVQPDKRNSGLGKTLMQKSIAVAKARFGAKEIAISAQLYLYAFYASLGFEKHTGTYLEDGIPHMGMKLTLD